jgi:signal transduction histidine kinase
MDDALIKRAETSALAYDQWIEAAKRQTQSLALMAPLREQTQIASSRKDLSQLSGPLNYFDGIYFIDETGKSVTSVISNDPPNQLTIRNLWENIRAQKIEVPSVFESGESGNSKLYFAAATANGGAIVTRINGDRLGEVFNDIRLSEGSVVTVFDPEGQVQYRRTSNDSDFDPSVLRTGLARAIHDKPYSIAEVVSPYDGIKRVYGVARTGDGSSLVAIGLVSDEYFSPLWTGLYQRIALASVILVVSVAVALAVALSIVGPIRSLQKATNEFAAGDRDARAETSASGELGELAKAFNEMATQINTREDKLKEADRMRSDYVSSVSHELKSPLTTIKTLTHVLESEGLSEEERLRFLNMIDAECDRQISFVSDLLDAAAVEEATPETEVARIDLPSVVRDSINRELVTADAKQVHIIFEPISDLPKVVSNANSLQRIFGVLLENAIRFSPGRSSIDITTLLNAREIEVRISDYGPGIDRTDLPNIFDKFYRGRNTNHFEYADGGNRVGLGLFIARRLANQIGCRIEAQNGSTGGAIFSVFVPVANGKKNGSADISS